MYFCQNCGTKARKSAKFCSSCGSGLQENGISSAATSLEKSRTVRRGILLSLVLSIALCASVIVSMNIQRISSSFENILNPVPEKVFVQLSKPLANKGWVQGFELEVQIESNKQNRYEVVLEIKNRDTWKSTQIRDVIFNEDDMSSKKFTFWSTLMNEGTREYRVKVLRNQGNKELVEISESLRVSVPKIPQGMNIADDSNYSIVWRFATESEKPEYCLKFKRCYFLLVASTKRCLIKATLLMQDNRIVSINSVNKKAIGAVAAYTPKKPYLIEIPYNSANDGRISARCFALTSKTNQGSSPTPTKEPIRLCPVLSEAEIFEERMYIAEVREQIRNMEYGAFYQLNREILENRIAQAEARINQTKRC